MKLSALTNLPQNILTRLLIEGEQVQVIEKYLNSAGTSQQIVNQAWDLAGAMLTFGRL